MPLIYLITWLFYMLNAFKHPLCSKLCQHNRLVHTDHDCSIRVSWSFAQSVNLNQLFMTFRCSKVCTYSFWLPLQLFTTMFMWLIYVIVLFVIRFVKTIPNSTLEVLKYITSQWLWAYKQNLHKRQTISLCLRASLALVVAHRSSHKVKWKNWLFAYARQIICHVN